MLSLGSPDWQNFETYSGDAKDLPKNLQLWREAIGTANEEGQWGWLRDQFLCQHTIKDSAIAIVPHICRLLHSTTPDLRPFYIVDLGQVHMAWRRRPIESLSGALIASYEAAVESVRPFACECLTLPMDAMEFRYVLSACAALCDHSGLGRFLFSLDCTTNEFPDLKGYV